jgi:hypothetical protein
MALDQARYEGGEHRITTGMLATAWKNYFVNLDVDPDAEAAPAAQSNTQEDL